MHPDVERILFSQEEIAGRVKQLAADINERHKGREVVLISVLKGSFIFMADLVRAVTLPCQVDFMVVSSYGNKSETTGAVSILKDLSLDVEGKDILLIEDILDSGVTLSYLLNVLSARKPASVEICTLLDKPSRRRVEVKADYLGFSIPDAFVVGYGLDFAEHYRNLPYIGVLHPRVYQ